MVQNIGKLWQGETSLPCFSAIRHPYTLLIPSEKHIVGI